MSENMRGLFFIVKGQYTKSVEPSFKNDTGGVSYIGGYDPYSEDTMEWYMLLDNRTFQCIACGRDFDKILKGVYNTIKRYKGSAERYFRSLENANYGKGFLPSPAMRCLHEHIYDEYGDFYSDEIREMEDLAYSELAEEKPFNKSKKLVSKHKKTMEVLEKEEVRIDTSTPKKVKPKVKLGVKKLTME